jgi:hypothetical protein
MNEKLRDKLIGAEAEDPALRAEYERRLQAMLETPLTTSRKMGSIFALVACAATVVLSAAVAFRFRNGPPVVLEGMALGALFGLAGLVLIGRMLLRGTFRHDLDSSRQAGLIWVFVVLLVTLFMVAGGISSIQGVGLTVIGIVFLIGAGVMLLRTVVEQSELRTREKLLELELRLAKISEDVGKLRRDERE